MAHFALIDGNSTVAQVIVVNNDTIHNLPFPASEAVGVAFCQSIFGAGTIWKQTSYNGNFRKNYAGIGFKYDDALDAFIPPQLYPSWVLNTETCTWKAPVAMPNDGNPYVWDEPTTSWVRLQA
jgi:hypothetical protein